MPKVSVLIPVYNAEKFIIDSVNSILHQSLKDFELILLDDYSSDNSKALIEQINDKRVRIYQNDKNLGISKSRNKLMELAQGEYLAIMDCDDLSTPDRLKKQVAFMDNNPDISMVGTWGELFNKNKTVTLIKKIKKFIINLGWVWCQPKHPDLVDMLKGNTMMHSSMMLRKSDMLANGIKYNEKYTPAEDYDIVKQAMFKGLGVANIQEVLFKYNLHGDNFSLKKKDKMKQIDTLVKQEISKFLGVKYKKYPYLLVIMKKLRLKHFL